MRILALEPFYGGSHKSFLDGWQKHSQHEFTVLGLPAYKWKWRMRHSAITFASQLHEPAYRDRSWDVLWCSDMLNVAEFIGLAPAAIRDLPRAVYFHENQLTYPVREEKDRDLHFAFSNFITAVAANEVWFNSQFHLNDFCSALEKYLLRMPDYQSTEEVELIRTKSKVQYPGIAPLRKRGPRKPGPLRICWNARWEHDKNPEDFFDAIRELKRRGVAFRLIVLGESFRNSPAIFHSARQEFNAEIEHWGYAKMRKEYEQWLSRADTVVSTANHEFFGIGVVEAMAAGAIPLLPDRLAYPEVLSQIDASVSIADFLYDGSVEQLVSRLQSLSESINSANWADLAQRFQNGARYFEWNKRALHMDAAIRLR